MLLNESKPFDSPDYIYELKLDGIRAVLYIDEQNISLKNKRNDELIERYPELKQAYKFVSAPCVLDGEIICTTNGLPDFAKLQKRALLTNAFKIKLLMKSSPIQFVAYDILQKNDKILLDDKLSKRKAILEDTVTDSELLLKSRYVQGQGTQFFELTKQQGLEGIVAKHLDSTYHLGKRSNEWLKIKALHDEDFLIFGYKLNDKGGVKDVLLLKEIKQSELTALKKAVSNLSQKAKSKTKNIKRNNQENYLRLVKKDDIDFEKFTLNQKTYICYNAKTYQYMGSVALGISHTDSEFLLNYAKTHTINLPFDIKDAHFIEPKYYCTVVYMLETARGHLRQPVYKGIRNDRGVDFF